jgi:FKBP-type peptidyl-prolyl cis-trans isomerase FkpA
MKAFVLLALLLCSALPALAEGEVEPKTDEEKTLYAIGAVVGQNLKVFDLSPQELEQVKKGVRDRLSGDSKSQPDLQSFREKIGALANERGTAQAAKQKEASKGYLAKAAQEPGAKKLPSGLIITVLKEGQGPSPKPTDKVKVNYEGKLVDGTVFDSSYKRGQPAEFPLNGVIKCWTEGVGLMKVGEKARLVCPADIAYGEAGHPPIPGGATLVFEVELLGING